MAGSMALALAEASGPEFDRAVGFTIDRPEPAPVDPAIEANFARHDFNVAFRRVKFGLAKQWRCDITICDEAIQNAITHLFETDRDLFTKPPDEWMTLLFVVAGRTLGRSLKRKGRVSSIDGLWKENGEGALTGARPAVPASIEGMDEDARLAPSPEMGGRWERLEMLGAAQRFRDANGRPPTKEECRTGWRRLEFAAGAPDRPGVRQLQRLPARSGDDAAIRRYQTSAGRVRRREGMRVLALETRFVARPRGHR